MGPSTSQQESTLSVPSEVEKISFLSNCIFKANCRQQNLPSLQLDTNLITTSQEKQSASFSKHKSQMLSQRSKHCGTSGIASSASHLEEARIELKLARFQKAQSEERMEEDELRRKED